MSRTYYPCLFRLDSRERYLIRHSDDTGGPDGVFVNERGEIPIFPTSHDLSAYAESAGLSLWSDETPICHDLDAVAKWLTLEDGTPLDCAEFLSGWDLFTNVSTSIGGDFDRDKRRTQKIYEKMFWGSNFLALTPSEGLYEPTWSGEERRIIREVLENGSRIFRSCLHLQNTSASMPNPDVRQDVIKI